MSLGGSPRVESECNGATQVHLHQRMQYVQQTGGAGTHCSCKQQTMETNADKL